VAWAEATVVLITVAALAWVPGWCVAAAWRAPVGVLGGVLGRLTIAPVLTFAAAAPAAVVAHAVGVRWSVWWLAAATLVLCAPALVARRPVVHAPREDVPRPGRGLLAAIALGIGLQVVPLLAGMGRPGRLLSGWDAVWHLNALRLIHQTGDASSFSLTAVNSLDGTSDGYYPAAWHAVTALVPVWPDLAVVDNMSVLLLTTVPWTLGIVALARVTFPSRPRLWTWSAALSAAGASLPAYLAFGSSGLTPNAVAGALWPGVLALVIHVLRRPTVSSVVVTCTAVAGLAAVHSNAAVTLAVAVGPWVAVVALPHARRLVHRPAGIALVAVAGAAVVGAVVLVATSTRAEVLSSYDGAPSQGLGRSLVDLLSGEVGRSGPQTGFVLMAAGLVGIVAARRLPRARAALLAAGALSVLYLLTASPPAGLEWVGRAWYGEPRRFAAALVATVLPFAALAADSGTRVLLRRLRAERPRVPAGRRAATVTAAAVLAVAGALGVVGLGSLSHDAFHGSAMRSALASDDELAMLHRLPDELGAGTVLGTPLSGSASLFGLTGVPVVPRTGFPPDDADLRVALTRISAAGTDPAVCDALERLGVRYVYVDPKPFMIRPETPVMKSAPAGSRLVDEGGTAKVYELTACGTR